MSINYNIPTLDVPQFRDFQLIGPVIVGVLVVLTTYLLYAVSPYLLLYIIT